MLQLLQNFSNCKNLVFYCIWYYHFAYTSAATSIASASVIPIWDVTCAIAFIFLFSTFLGNIALHLFLPATRQKYDLESLWTVGSEYDERTREEHMVTDFAFDELDLTGQQDTSVTKAHNKITVPRVSAFSKFQQHANNWQNNKLLLNSDLGKKLWWILCMIVSEPQCIIIVVCHMPLFKFVKLYRWLD